MIPALKAEFRKLATVRSSYVIPGIAFVLLAFAALYIEGYKNGVVNTAGPGPSTFLANSIAQHASVLSIFGALVALLLMTHEYRYSTIMYSLTITNRRSKVLVAKIIAIAVYTFLLALVGTIFGFVCMIIGLHLTGHALPVEHLDYLAYFGKLLFFCEGWSMFALVLALVLRNQVAAIAVLFIVPNTVEGLLSLLLKDKTVYLPFNALSQVVMPPFVDPRAAAVTGSLTPLKGALIFLAYLVVAWVVGWIFFLKRDAN